MCEFYFYDLIYGSYLCHYGINLKQIIMDPAGNSLSTKILLVNNINRMTIVYG